MEEEGEGEEEEEEKEEEKMEKKRAKLGSSWQRRSRPWRFR